MRYEPPRGGDQSYVHMTHVRSGKGGGLSVVRVAVSTAGFQFTPPSVLTSTALMRRVPANAMPPILTDAPTTVPAGGVATIAVVRICPSFVHPFCCQNPFTSPRTTVIRFTHFAENIPYLPGTTSRAGCPWFTANGPSFIECATIVVGSCAFARGI